MALVGAGDYPRKLIGAVDQGTSSSRFLVHSWSSSSWCCHYATSPILSKRPKCSHRLM